MAIDDSPVWFPVVITECIVILLINGITIAAFGRIHNLRKCSTPYLIINLTVADLLVGAVAGTLTMYHESKESNGFTWPGFIYLAIEMIFPIASQVNLSLIS